MLRRLPFVTKTFGVFNRKVRRSKRATALAAGLALTGMLVLNQPVVAQPQEEVTGLTQVGGQSPFGFGEDINYYTYDHVFADVDSDGDFDLIFIDAEPFSELNGEILGVENIGDRYNPNFDYSSKGISSIGNLGDPSSGPSETISLDAGNFNNDNYYDLAVLFVQDGDLTSSDTVLSLFYGDSSYNFDPYSRVDVPLPSFFELSRDFGIGPTSGVSSFIQYATVSLADLDADGDLDIILPFVEENRYSGPNEADVTDFLVLENVGNPYSAAFSVSNIQYGLPGIAPITGNGEYGSVPHAELVDLDEDGDLDAVVTIVNFQRDPQLEILQYSNEGNRYSGSFSSTDSLIDTSDFGQFYLASPPSSFEFVDFDGDSDLDILIPRFTRSLYGGPKSGEHGFGSARNLDKLPPGFNTYWAAFENGPIVPSTGGPVAEFERVPRNYYGQPYALNYANDGYGIIDFDLVDFDADGDLDLAFQYAYSTNTVTIRENDGNAVYPSFYGGIVEFELPGYAPPFYGMSFADLDADGDQDAAFLTDADNLKIGGSDFDFVLFLAENDENATGSLIGTLPLPNIGKYAPFPPKFTFVDIDADGDQDIVVAGQTYGRDASLLQLSTTVNVYENYGNANFPQFFQTKKAPGLPPNFGREIALDYNLAFAADPEFADLDRDGDLDLVLTGISYNYSGPPRVGISQFENIGDLTNPEFVPTKDLFDSSEINLPSLYGKGRPYYQDQIASKFADLDGDSDADLVTFIPNYNGFVVHTNVGDNDKTLQFDEVEAFPDLANLFREGYYSGNGVYRVSYNLHEIRLADIDADGDLDLISFTEYAYEQYNKGSFGAGVEYTTNMSFFENIGDAANPEFTTSSSLLGSRSGSYYLGIDNPTFFDIDRDGDIDLAFTGFLGSEPYSQYLGPYAFYFLNTGSATSPAFDFSVSGSYSEFYGLSFSNDYYSSVFADFNGDRSLDAFFPYEDGGDYQALSFGTDDTIPRFNNGITIVGSNFGNLLYAEAYDLDCDGDLDFIDDYFDYFYISLNDGNRVRPGFNNGYDYYLSVGIDEDEFTIGDIDGDGDADIVMVSDSGGLYFINNSSYEVAPGIPEPPRYNPEFERGYLPNFSDENSGGTFDFVDLNADGLLDIFRGYGYSGQNARITGYYNRGSAYSPYFDFSDDSNSPYENKDILFGRGASDFAHADIDADGDQDILLVRGTSSGDFDSAYLYINNGYSEYADFNTTSTTPTPSPYTSSTLVASLDDDYFGHAKFVDLDADGDYDIVFAANERTKGPGYSYFAVFENIGSATSHEFVRSNDRFGLTLTNAEAYLDIPEFIDADRDGDLDVFVSGFEFNAYGLQQFAVIGENVGTATEPNFEFSQTDEFYGIPFNYSENFKGGNTNIISSLTFGDVDNDGDLDAIAFGDEEGVFYENTVPADPIPYFAPGEEVDFGIGIVNNRPKSIDPNVPTIINASNSDKGDSLPEYTGLVKELVDLDGDGALDLFRARGNFYDNIFGPSSPTGPPKGSISNYDVVTAGYIDWFGNQGNATDPQFLSDVANDTIRIQIENSRFQYSGSTSTWNDVISISASDIDLDGDQDFFVSLNQRFLYDFTSNRIATRSFFLENTGTAISPEFAVGEELLTNGFSIVDLGDMNHDGLDDIVATNDPIRCSTNNPGSNSYIGIFINALGYRNKSEKTFSTDANFYFYDSPQYNGYYDISLDFSGEGNLVDLDRDGDLDLVMSRTHPDYYGGCGKGYPGNPDLDRYDYPAIEVLENLGLPYLNVPKAQKGDTGDGIPVFARDTRATEFIPNLSEDYLLDGDIVVADIDLDGDLELISDQFQFRGIKGDDEVEFYPAIIFDGNYFAGPPTREVYIPEFETSYLPRINYLGGGAQFTELDADGLLDIVNDDRRSRYGREFNAYYNDGEARDPYFNFDDENYLATGQGNRLGAFSFGDIDCDGDEDIVTISQGITDGKGFDHSREDPYIALLTNRGNADIAEFYYGDVISLSGISLSPRLGFGEHIFPSLIDIDTDGDLDLIISEFSSDQLKGDPIYSSSLRAYENTGDANSYNFTRRNDNFGITLNGTNFGLSRLEFIDFDRDGDLDFVAPSFNPYNGGYAYEFIVGENTGSATSPAFDLSVTDNFYGVPVSIYSYYDKGTGDNFPVRSISFGDIDRDGDYDALTGGEYINFHENGFEALPIPYLAEGEEVDFGLGFNTYYYAGPPKASEKLPPFLFETPGYNKAKELVDIDGDGDLDLILAYGNRGLRAMKIGGIGEYIGNLEIQYNTGNATDPVFDVDNSTTSSQLIAAPRFINNKIITFGDSTRILSLSSEDIDLDGDQDLFATVAFYEYDDRKLPGGRYFDGVNSYYFENIGSKTSPEFADGQLMFPRGQGIPKGGINPSTFMIIDLADMDGDGDADLALGGFYGFGYNQFSVPPISNVRVLENRRPRFDDDKGYNNYYDNYGFEFDFDRDTTEVLFEDRQLNLSGEGNLVDLDRDGDYDLIMSRTKYNYYYDNDKAPGDTLGDYPVFEILENVEGNRYNNPKGGIFDDEQFHFIQNSDPLTFIPEYSRDYYVLGDIAVGDIDHDGDIEVISDQRSRTKAKGGNTGPTGPTTQFIPAIIFDGDYFPAGEVEDDTAPYVYDPVDTADLSSDTYQYFYWTEPYDPESGISELLLEIADSDDFSNILQSVDVTDETQLGIELDEGDNFARLVATNGAGLTSTSGPSDGIFIDSQQVIVTLDGVVIATNDPLPTFTGTFSDPDPSSGVDSITFRAKGNGLPSTLFSATFDDSQTSSTWSGQQQIPLPVEGFYDFQFRGIDGAFNRAFTVIEDAIVYDITNPFISDFRFVEIVDGGYAMTSLTLELQFSDNLTDVSGFDPADTGDLVITGPGGLNPTPITGGPNFFSFSVDPMVEGTYTLQVADSAAEDAAGNPSSASNVLSFIYDITPPELICDAAFGPFGGSRQSGDSVFVTAEFNEPVIGFIEDAVTVSGNAVFGSITPTPGPDTTFVIELLATGLGPVTIELNDGFITDLAGNEFDAFDVETTIEILPTVDQLPDPAPYFASDGASNDRFGQDVDIDGSVVVVGASGVGNNGAVYVLEAEDPTTFTEVQQLVADDGASGDNFGFSVGVSGDWIIVGAPNDDDNQNSSGSVYFFRREEAEAPQVGKGVDEPTTPTQTWTQVQKFVASDFPGIVDERLGRFGTTVAINGSTAVIGRPLESRGGSAFVLNLDICDGDLGTWIPVQRIVPNDQTSRDEFSTSIDLGSDVLAIGSRRDDDRGSDTGSVYVYRRVGGMFVQETKIVPGDADRLDQIGTSVSLFDNILAFGSPGDDDVASASGAGLLYGNPVSATWLPMAKLTTTIANSGDGFGHSIAVNGSTVLLGAPLNDIEARDAGAVVQFTGDIAGGVKSLPAKLAIVLSEQTITFPIAPTRNDRFGSAVAIDDTVGIIGAPLSDAVGFNFGAVSFTGVESEDLD